jgi:hypothetical protein
MATVEGLSRPISARQAIARASFWLLPGWELVTDLGIAKNEQKAGWHAGQRKVAEWLLAGKPWDRNRMTSADIYLRLAGLPGELCSIEAAWPTNSDGVLGLAKQLWCHCNTLEIFKQRHITGRIAWSHEKRISTNWGALC